MDNDIYEWVEHWAQLPNQPPGWMHSGVAVYEDSVVVAHPGEPTLLFFDVLGQVRRVVALEGFVEPHGFSVSDGGLWIADVGFKRRVRGSEFQTDRRVGRVACVDRDGRIVRELRDPGSGWSPTSVAVVRESGDVWVADGYGRHVVHQFDRDGRHVRTLTGEEGAGRFSCPHAVIVDRRRRDPELYITDRANARLQVFDLEGCFRRVAGVDVVVTPTDMVVVGNQLALTDFTEARVTLLDERDQLIAHLGANAPAAARDGWPNARDPDGSLVPPPLEHGRFNSPHTLAADRAGNLYVTEWLLGGRLSKLRRL